MTIGEAYEPAMEIQTQEEADSYFEMLITDCMTYGKTREEAIVIQKSNLGYFAGYYDSATRERVERLFGCQHPVFGSIAQHGNPSTEEALLAGIKHAQPSQREGGGR